MPSHADLKSHTHDGRRPDKKSHGKGPKEKEIAATLTAAAVALAGGAVIYPSLDAAGDAVAHMYSRMFELVAAGPPGER